MQLNNNSFLGVEINTEELINIIFFNKKIFKPKNINDKRTK